jgi:hypothetical protein
MQRERFFFSLASLAGGGLLVIAALAFDPHAVFGVGLGIGIAVLVGSLWFVGSVIHMRTLAGAQQLHVRGRTLNMWLLIGGGVLGVALWETVQSAVFVAAVAKWLTFSNGLVLGALACAALIAHEISSERVIHVLQVIERRDPLV